MSNHVDLKPRIGRVVSATGAQIIALLDDAQEGPITLEIGQLVKFMLSQSVAFGIISGLSNPMPGKAEGHEPKLAQIDLIGEALRLPAGLGSFHRGISLMPSLDDIVIVAAEEDTRHVYARPDRPTIEIGNIHQDPRVRAHVGVDDMLSKHFALVGTTGAGKSCSLTLILRRILERNPNAHILLLDPHGEYATAFPDQALHLTAETLELPYWLFTFEELVEVVFGNEAKDLAAETLYLREFVLAAKIRFAGSSKDTSRITVDVPIPYTMGDLSRLLDDAIGKQENRSGNLAAYLRLKSRLASVQSDRRFSFMFPTGVFVSDNLSQLLGRIFRVPVLGKPLAILDLAGVPSEVLNVVVSVLCRMAFDFAVWGQQEVPLLLVCEEAHRYAPQDTTLGFEPAKRALARIAKEGRKYGIGLCVVSQRPSELAASLLSQCNTVFALRMSSLKDQQIIQAALSEASSTLLESLPLLGTAEAVVVGEGVPVPMRLRFDELPPDQRPRSNSAPFTMRWQDEVSSKGLLERIVDAWRGQKPPPAVT